MRHAQRVLRIALMAAFGVALVATVWSSACVPNYSIEVTGMSRVDKDCKEATNEAQPLVGYVDTGWTSAWLGVITVNNRLVEDDKTRVVPGAVGGTIEGANTFYVERLIITYTDPATNRQLAPSVQESVGSTIPAQGESTIRMGVSLPNSLAPTSQGLEVLFGFQVEGTLASGQKLTSNTFRFPIVFRDTGIVLPRCAPPETGRCKNYGQDGDYYTCGGDGGASD